MKLKAVCMLGTIAASAACAEAADCANLTPSAAAPAAAAPAQDSLPQDPLAQDPLVEAKPPPEQVNPLLIDSALPCGAPDFLVLRDEHFVPALERGMTEAMAEVREIADNPAPPTFENTLEAWERSGRLLDRARRLLTQLNNADGNKTRQQISRDMAPRLAAHDDAVLLDAALYRRIAALYQQRDSLALTAEQDRLLERRHTAMLRAGAALPQDHQRRLRDINQRLAILRNRFQDNFTDDATAFVHHVTDAEQLRGLSQDLVTQAAETARERGFETGWAFTLGEPMVFGVLREADHRALRETLYTAYKNRGNNGNEFDNNALAGEIAALRAEAAQLLGFKSHAHYVAADNMAGHPDAIMEMLTQLWSPALRNARLEAERLQQQIDAEGAAHRLEAWDWWYYAERVRAAEFDLDEDQLRPYFELNRVRDGAFLLAHRLWGVSFHARDDIPGYHPDVQVFEMRDAQGHGGGLLYMDFLARPNKRFGAWMSAFQVQSHLLETAPVVTNTSNFGPAVRDEPVLLTYEQATTLFHEFGHAIHGLFSEVTYPSFSGTAVARDFVELPSQLLENWVAQPEMLAEFAHHHATGEPIASQLVEKLRAAQQFNEGFAATEYLASALVDMAWHLRGPDAPVIEDAIAFEQQVMRDYGLIPQILPRHRSTHFSHIFPGGYSAGYYSYIWAAVLDADAFEAFREQGLFDRELGERLRREVLSVGGAREPMQAYIDFRGAPPATEPLLRRRGLMPMENDEEQINAVEGHR